MRILTIIAVLMWLFTSSLPVADASTSITNDSCHEKSTEHADMDHAMMDHDVMDHDVSTSNSKENQTHHCETNCCDGLCLCNVSCGSIAAVTPSTVAYYGVKLDRKPLAKSVKSLNNAPLKLRDPPPRFVA